MYGGSRDPVTVAEDGSKEAYRAGLHGGKMAENRSAALLVAASGTARGVDRQGGGLGLRGLRSV
jgi:hypothetical protein